MELGEINSGEGSKNQQVEIQVEGNAPTYLQPHSGNGVFGNVYLLPLHNNKR